MANREKLVVVRYAGPPGNDFCQRPATSDGTATAAGFDDFKMEWIFGEDSDGTFYGLCRDAAFLGVSIDGRSKTDVSARVEAFMDGVWLERQRAAGRRS